MTPESNRHCYQLFTKVILLRIALNHNSGNPHSWLLEHQNQGPSTYRRSIRQSPIGKLEANFQTWVMSWKKHKVNKLWLQQHNNGTNWYWGFFNCIKLLCLIRDYVSHFFRAADARGLFNEQNIAFTAINSISANKAIRNIQSTVYDICFWLFCVALYVGTWCAAIFCAIHDSWVQRLGVWMCMILPFGYD